MRRTGALIPALLGVLAGLAAAAEPPNAQEPRAALAAPYPGITAAPAEEPCVPLDLQTALSWTLSSNPDLIAVRQNLCVSAEAVGVARRLPASLNPSVSVDVAPWVFERTPGNGVERLDPMVTVSLQQPIELGHRTRFRLSEARASYGKEQWNVVQAEFQAVVQTYRLYQTAAYRRDKVQVARELADFSNRLLATIQRQVDANQAPAADLVLAEVEGQTARQDLIAAEQEHVVALSALRRQIGFNDDHRFWEPAEGLQLPACPVSDEQALVERAMTEHPEIGAAAAQVEVSRSALSLARADRIPTPSLGPTYERNETGASFYGLAVSSPLPVLNAGAPLVRQREAEHNRDRVVLEQVRQRVRLQVRDAHVRWTQSLQMAARTRAVHEPIEALAARMERLYQAGQADLTRLLQVRQRLIEAQNVQLDALWQATQAYADLLAAVGVTPLVEW